MSENTDILEFLQEKVEISLKEERKARRLEEEINVKNKEIKQLKKKIILLKKTVKKMCYSSETIMTEVKQKMKEINDESSSSDDDDLPNAQQMIESDDDGDF